MEHPRTNTASYDILITKLKNSDVHAVEQLFRQYYEPLVHYALRYVNDAHIAENLICDVYVSLWKNRHNIDLGIHIKTYLYNATRNRAFNYLKKVKREKAFITEPVDVAFDPDTPESMLLEKEMQRAIQEAIEMLPPKCREIFCMSRFDDLTYNEIASILDISIKTVETQMSRALKHLRKHLSFFFNA